MGVIGLWASADQGESAPVGAYTNPAQTYVTLNLCRSILGMEGWPIRSFPRIGGRLRGPD